MAQSNHRDVLEKYRATLQGDGWHTAQDDGYLYDHLVYHLKAVEAHDEIRALFADHAWLLARVSQSGQYDAYLADLDTAWQLSTEEANRQIVAGKEATALLDCIRYALIQTSINSIAGNDHTSTERSPQLSQNVCSSPMKTMLTTALCVQEN